MPDSARRAEIDANYDFLQRELARILPRQAGRYALIKSCRFEGFFDTPGNAYRDGVARFPGDLPFLFEEIDGFSRRRPTEFDIILGMDVLSRCEVTLSRGGTCRLAFG